MSGDVLTWFSKTCKAAGPLVLGVQEDGAREVLRAFDQPFLLIGRNSGCDLVLDHEQVARRHVYLQVIAGRVFCVDLESRAGVSREGEPLRSGWIDRGQTLQVGPLRLRLAGGGTSSGPPDQSSPLQVNQTGPHPLAKATLEISGEGSTTHKWPICRELVLVGRAPLCNVRIRHPGLSLFHCALVRTPEGVWLVDLLSSWTFTLNGTRVRLARLEEGDEIGLGPFAIRLRYDMPLKSRGLAPVSTNPGDSLARGSSSTVAPGPSSASLAPSTGEEAAMQALTDRMRVMQAEMVDQLQQMMTSMMQMFGKMQRDHLDVVREELEQIRRLTEEMQALRTEVGPPAGAPADFPATSETPPQPSSDGLEAADGLGSAIDAAAPGRSSGERRIRRDPKETQASLDERLAAFERERQGRWYKVLELLTGRS